MSGGGTNTNTVQSAPPQQVLDAYSAAQAKAAAAANAPLQQYQGQTVAGFTPDQLAAMQTINNAQGIQQPYINKAADLASSAATPITPTQFTPGNVQQYLSPYTQNVVDATTAQMRNMDTQQQQQLRGNAVSQGAWGGDRAGVAQAELANQQDLANNQTIAGLYNQDYTQALGEFNQQQTTGVNAQSASDWLAANAASTYGALGNEAQTGALTGANAQLTSGTLQQQLAQENLNVPYQQFLQQQAYPFQTSQFLTSAAEGLSNQGGGSRSTSPGVDTTAQDVGAAASLGLAAYAAFAAAKRGGRIEEPRGFAGGGTTPLGAGSGGIALPAPPNVNVSFIPTSTASNPVGGMGIPNAPGAAPTQDSTQTMANGLNSGIQLAHEINGLKKPATASAAPAGPDATSATAGFANPAFFGDEYGGSDIGIPPAAHGGRIGFDDGGAVQAGLADAGVANGGNPIGDNLYSQYAQMPTEKLQELASRVPPNSPYAQYIQRALMAARMKPAQPVQGAPQAPASVGIAAPPAMGTPQPGMRRGGFVHGFADGGAPDPNDYVAIASAYGDPNVGLLDQLGAAANAAGTYNTMTDPQGYSPSDAVMPPPRPASPAPVLPQGFPIAPSEIPGYALDLRAPPQDAGPGNVSPSLPPDDGLANMGDTYAGAFEPPAAKAAPPDYSGIGDVFAGNAAGPRGVDTLPADLVPTSSDEEDTVGAGEEVPSQAILGKPPVPGGAAPTGMRRAPVSPSAITNAPALDLSGAAPSALNPSGGVQGAAPVSNTAAATGIATPPPVTPQNLAAAKKAGIDTRWLPLIAAFAGMAASRSHTFAGAVGEGALKGLEAYGSQEREDRAQQLADQQGRYQQGELANSSQRVKQDGERLLAAAQEARLTHAETARHNQADEGLRSAQIGQTGAYQQGELGLRAQQIQAEQAYHNSEIDYRNKMAERGKNILVPYTKMDENGKSVTGYRSYDTVNNVLGPPLADEQGTVTGNGKTGSSGGVSAWKHGAWLAAHPGDEQGALDYASGRRQMSEQDIAKSALSMANTEIGRMMVPPADPKAYVETRAPEIAAQIRTGFGAAGQPRAAVPAGRGAPTSFTATAPWQAPAGASAAEVKQQFDALPRGSVYTNPADGQLYEKQ